MAAVADAIGRLDSWRDQTYFFDATPILWPQRAGHSPQRESRTDIGHLSLLDEPRDQTPILTTLQRYAGAPPYWSSERPWIPWAFELAPGHPNAVSSVGLGAIAAGLTLYTAGSVAAGATPLLPSQRVFRLINPGQISLETTSLWDEAATLVLRTPGLLPRRLRVRESVQIGRASCRERV